MGSVEDALVGGHGVCHVHASGCHHEDAHAAMDGDMGSMVWVAIVAVFHHDRHGLECMALASGEGGELMSCSSFLGRWLVAGFLQGRHGDVHGLIVLAWGKPRRWCKGEGAVGCEEVDARRGRHT